MGRRAFTISLLAFLGFVILQTVSADESSEELAAQLNSNVGSSLEPSENQFRLIRSLDAESKKPKRKPNGRKPKRKPGFNNQKRVQGNRRKGGNTGSEKKKKGRKPRPLNGKSNKKWKYNGRKNPGKKGNENKRPNGKKNQREKGKGNNRHKGIKNQKKKKKKKGNGNGNNRHKGRKNPKKKGNVNKRPSGKKGNFKAGWRQECNEQELCKRIKLYIKYSNQQRKAKRILRTCKTMKSKHDKAGTEFEATAAAIKNSDDTNVTAIQATLATCKTTAKALCADTNVEQCSAEEQAKIEACVTKLKTWIEAFGPGASSCLGKESCCACINSIEPAVTDDCLNYDTIDKESLKKKTKCTKSEAGGGEKGSFGDCRKQQQLAAEQGPPAFGKKCKNGAVTTAKPSGRKKKAVLKIRKELNIKK